MTRKVGETVQITVKVSTDIVARADKLIEPLSATRGVIQTRADVLRKAIVNGLDDMRILIPRNAQRLNDVYDMLGALLMRGGVPEDVRAEIQIAQDALKPVVNFKR